MSKEENRYYSAKPKLGTNTNSKLRQHFNRGLTAFLVVASCIVFYFLLLRVTNVSFAFGAVYGALKPVVYGCVIAYLLNPLVKKLEEFIYPIMEERMKKKSAFKVTRGISVFLSLAFLIFLIFILCYLLIPELYSSIRNLVYVLPVQISGLINSINNIQVSDSAVAGIVKTTVEEAMNMFETWLRTDILGQFNDIMSNLTEGIISLVSEVFDFLVGLIVSVYVMYSREVFVRQAKKITYAIFSPHRANLILHIGTKANEIFGGFIIGKIIDSIIIGIMAFIALSIMKMPYVVLVSVIIGVTNVIPFFGPFIGAVPCSILILLNDPMKGLYFVIFIFILQQFDGNILGPKILGDSTGLSSFWVIVAILFGGGLFGFAGMLLGVPTFAMIMYIARLVLDERLENKNLPTNSRHYHTMSYVDEYGKFVYTDERKHRRSQEERDKEAAEKAAKKAEQAEMKK